MFILQWLIDLAKPNKEPPFEPPKDLHKPTDQDINNVRDGIDIAEIVKPEPEKPMTQKFNKEFSINSVIGVEGGYVNHPSDRGGETNFGITKAMANKAATKKRLVAMGWNGNMRNLTREMAYVIYDIEYWSKLKLDDVSKRSPVLADKLFDQGVNAGNAMPGKWLQRALNACNRQQKDYKDIIVDGIIGSATLVALDGLIKKRGLKGSIQYLLTTIVSFQCTHYIEISEKREANEDFVYGWVTNRVPHHLREYLAD